MFDIQFQKKWIKKETSWLSHLADLNQDTTYLSIFIGIVFLFNFERTKSMICLLFLGLSLFVPDQEMGLECQSQMDAMYFKIQAIT